MVEWAEAWWWDQDLEGRRLRGLTPFRGSSSDRQKQREASPVAVPKALCVWVGGWVGG